MALEALHADDIVRARTWLVFYFFLWNLPSTAYCATTTTTATTSTTDPTTTTMMTTTTEPATTMLMCGEGETIVGDECECDTGYYSTNGTCKLCSTRITNCVSCAAPSDQPEEPTCSRCNDTFYLHQDNTCHDKCPRGTIEGKRMTNSTSQMICVEVHPCTWQRGELYEVCVAVPIVGAAVIVGVILLAVCLVRKRNARPNQAPVERKQSILPNPFEREAPPEGMPTISEAPDNMEMAQIENVPRAQPAQPKKSAPSEDREYYGNIEAVVSTRDMHNDGLDDDPQEDYENFIAKPPAVGSKSLPNLKNEVPPPSGAGHSTKSTPGYVNLPNLPNNCISPDAKKHSYVNIQNKEPAEKGRFVRKSKQHSRPMSVTQGANNNGFNADDEEQTIYANA